MRGKNSDGSWKAPFNEYVWGGPYVEGSAWQCSWAVPHDPAGLMEVMGGPEALERTLDRMLELPPHFDVGSYGFEIHEMTEMACAVPGFGQYAHSNQPVHHVLYYYACAGKPAKTQYWVRRVLEEMYGSGPDGFAGDEDNGEMASWYVLSALGLFQICPGHPTYVLGSPLFEKAILDLGEGKTLVIRGEGNGPENVYVRGTEWNGEAYGNAWVSYEQLAGGGELTFKMDREASNDGPTGDALPYSLSTDRE
jgi:predicted alpha-1,2-mannosidase